jgi:hypothetical protein
VSQHHVRVGHRGQRASAAEGGRAGRHPGAPRPDAKRPSVIYPRDASAAGGDRFDEDAWEGDWDAGDCSARLDERLPVENQADVGARATDVDRERS